MKKIYWLFIFGFMLSSCNPSIDYFRIIDLNSNWEFQQSGKKDWYSATVPGTVHGDLMDHQLIPDPFIGKNEDEVQWIENEDWVYKTEFVLSEEEISANSIDLVFEGIDTYADVYLNEELIIQSDNMFLEWAADCKPHLKAGKNSLRLYFHSPVKIGLEKAAKLNYLLVATNEQAPDGKKTNVFTRKAPFHFGWDWGPRLVTSGLWRPVYLRIWKDAYIDDVYLNQASFSVDQANYESEITVACTTKGQYQLEVISDGKSISKTDASLNAGMNKINLKLEFDQPELWWPNGLGEARLYHLDFVLLNNKKEIHKISETLGIRKIELIQEADEIGKSFYFKVNGVPVFMKGANYIPGDILLPRVDTAKYRRVIQEAVDANMNMLRVWGGAIYENDIFYDLCDENGILIWQDFMFACALQPGDEAHLDNIRKEAEYNVKRLRNHPSMALWCGNNENLTAWKLWGWPDLYSREVSDFLWETYERIFYEILPAAVEKYDPDKSYWASSPQTWDKQLADRKSGDEHDWTIWFAQKPFSDYGQNLPRFASEYGLQSFPQLSTIDSFSTANEQYIFSDLLNRRQRSKMEWIGPGFNGNDMQLKYIRDNFGEPENFKEFVYFSQINHQLGTKEAIEAHRRNMPYTMGSLYWQINDCWPTMSWATVDYYGNWKAAHYQAKRSFENILIAEEFNNDAFRIYVVSDKLEHLKGQLQLQWFSSNGDIIGEATEIEVLLNKNTSSLVYEGLTWPEKDKFLYVKLNIDGEFISDKIISSQLPKDIKTELPEIKCSILEVDGKQLLSINANKPVWYLHFEYIDSDIRFEDNYFHLSPLMEKKVGIISSGTEEFDMKKLRIESLNYNSIDFQ